MACFERKILKSIYGPILENEVYRKRTNGEVPTTNLPKNPASMHIS